MSLLALILFSPWFAILAWAYWRYPRQAAVSPRRRLFDVAVVLLAVMASALAMHLAYTANDGFGGRIWKQVAATLWGYGAFLALLGLAWPLRARLFA
jgi:hypothetical protein